MRVLSSFSSYKFRLDGNPVMLASGNINSNVARQLSAYIKQDQSLCGYLHVLHLQLDPYIDRGVTRTWYVDGNLVEIKDWLVDDCEGLLHYPFPPLNYQPGHKCYSTVLAKGFDLPSSQSNESLSWYPHGANPTVGISAESPRANPKSLSEAWNKLELNPYAPQPSNSSNRFTTMSSTDRYTESSGPQSAGQQSPQVEDSTEQLDVTADGTVDRFIRKRNAVSDKRDTMAVFVHAGAGYHSLQNEHVHLTMCAKAAGQAMRCLKAGGKSTDAVAVAIKHLEDHDITNAGIGSNLTVDGQVEGDATMVDHFGRSGACGAVPNIKNPILLAKLILDTSLNSLTLRRVPPNMLIGEGAKKFAAEHGMIIVSNKDLVSKNAADRYKKWCEDLRKAEARANDTQVQGETGQMTPPNEASQATLNLASSDSQSIARTKASRGLLRDHSSAVLAGMWNEGQPDSPTADLASAGGYGSEVSTPTKRSPLSTSRNGFQSPKYHKGRFDAPTSQVRAFDSSDESAEQTPAKRRKTSTDEPVGSMDGSKDDIGREWGWAGKREAGKWIASLEYPVGNKKVDSTELTGEPADADPDLITDTIGVIAIDGQGNIAAGSSSGGIGMKHSGRVGPAALVGIGTAVIPRDKDDEDERVVATVTSGTGEHMATTMAAHKCAERLYHMTSRIPGGDFAADVCSEGEVMEDFVMADFMGHPGVRNQTSARAIGVLAVKMTSGGIYMHWAHNTDSFALAHMSSYDPEPLCVMSRLQPGARINVGAKKVYKNHAQVKKRGGK